LGKTVQIEDKLIQQLQRGESNAQFEIYERYSGAMYHTTKRMIPDPMLAEELMQDAFIKAFDRIDQYRGEATFGAWLKRIVVNECLDYLEKKKLEWSSLDENMPVVEEDSEEDFEWKVDEVKRAMSQLPDGYRVVLSLYLFEGYDHEEIAQIMNISGSTSRSQYLRAKKKLVQNLKDYTYAG
jgi:RNA polymerase sigma factor (sigma-70 family)